MYEPGRVPESNGNVEKYVPPQVSPAVATNPKYIPSTSSTSDASQPKSASSSSKALESSQSALRSDRQKNKTDRRAETRSTRQKNANRKRGHSPDLFGSEDEASETPPVVVKPLSSPDLPTNSKVSHRGKELTSSHSSRSNSQSKTKRANVRSNSKSNIIRPNSKTNNNIVKHNPAKESRPKIMSSEELKIFMDTKDEAINEMEKLRKMLKPEVLPDIEVITLKHFSLHDLELRFDEHKLNLKVLFENYCKQKVYNPLTILIIFIYYLFE